MSNESNLGFRNIENVTTKDTPVPDSFSDSSKIRLVDVLLIEVRLCAMRRNDPFSRTGVRGAPRRYGCAEWQ